MTVSELPDVSAQRLLDWQIATDPTVATFSVGMTGRLHGVSKNTAYILVARGDWPSVKVGRQHRIPASWVRAQLHIEVEA